MRFKPEYIALTVNVIALSYYLYQWREPGKILYWLGAVLITLGLVKMNG